MNTSNQATAKDWGGILTVGLVLVFAGVVVGFFSGKLPFLRDFLISTPAGIPNSAKTSPVDLSDDWIQIALTEPVWEEQIIPVLPPRLSNEVEVLLIVADANGALHYAMVRFNANNPDPSDIHIYVVDLVLSSPTQVTATMIGELSGRHLYYDKSAHCWGEAAYHGKPDAKKGCVDMG